MPINILQDNSASFTVEFLDTNGNLTVPSSATLSVVYTTTGGSTASSSAAMTLVGSFYTGTWNTTGVALGLYTYIINAAGQVVSPAATGQIRVIDP